MSETSENENSLVFSYLALRKTVGILGVLLPIVLSLGAVIIFQTDIQRSVSSYYHTGMGDVFVGTLFVIGFFLFSYKGYERSDDIAGDLGCVFAVGVALFRTTPENPASGDTLLIGRLHLLFAALFFLTLIYFSLVLFTKTDPNRPPTNKKLQRNSVYRACGYTMLGCIALITGFHFIPNETAIALKSYEPVFWLEAIAIIAFGVSWLTKGESLLKDEG